MESLSLTVSFIVVCLSLFSATLIISGLSRNLRLLYFAFAFAGLGLGYGVLIVGVVKGTGV